MPKSTFLLPMLASLFLLSGCGNSLNSTTPAPESCEASGAAVCILPTVETPVVTATSLDFSGTIDAVMLAIKTMDLPTLSQFVGTQGLRFSPYEHVDVTKDVVLTTELVQNGLTLSRSFNRGSYDGSGEPIDLGIGQYRKKFVYDVDFANAPEVYYNQQFTRGNIINNIFDIYTGKEIVEYHFSGFDAQYDGMDRRSLSLIFDHIDAQRLLIGIVHGARTI